MISSDRPKTLNFRALWASICGVEGIKEALKASGANQADFDIITEKVNDETANVYSIKEIVDGQKRKTDKSKEFIPGPPEEQAEVVRIIGTVLDTMREFHCNICGLQGH